MTIKQHRLVIIGGGPGGYEAALVAASGGADVTVIDSTGVGGAAVLTDCVPSKALIATGGYVGRVIDNAEHLGIHYRPLVPTDGDDTTPLVEDEETELEADVNLAEVNEQVMDLARAQSEDIEAGLVSKGIKVIRGRARLIDPEHVVATTPDGWQVYEADTILIATGSRPRLMESAMPDGERILTWQQIWDLKSLPEKLIVIGSGVTGVELAQAYLHLGCRVTLISSREHVLPGKDPDAAQVLEKVLARRGMEVLARSRADSVERTENGVVVTLSDGRTVEGSHVLLAVGSLPNTSDLGLAEAGVAVDEGGYIQVDRVSRTTAHGVYAAGDCTGVLPLASVAAMQGRIAVAHAIGDEVHPLNTMGISASIFTDPEIATVGMSDEETADDRTFSTIYMQLDTNPRAKMHNIQEGFVKLFAHRASNMVVGGVVVAPRASELIYPIALAVHNRLTADDMARTITVYPSLTGSIAEAARRLHEITD